MSLKQASGATVMNFVWDNIICQFLALLNAYYMIMVLLSWMCTWENCLMLKGRPCEINIIKGLFKPRPHVKLSCLSFVGGLLFVLQRALDQWCMSPVNCINPRDLWTILATCGPLCISGRASYLASLWHLFTPRLRIPFVSLELNSPHALIVPYR